MLYQVEFVLCYEKQSQQNEHCHDEQYLDAREQVNVKS